MGNSQKPTSYTKASLNCLRIRRMYNDSSWRCLDGRPLSGLDVFWDSDKPSLSACFTHTILIWLQCAVFWSTLPFEILKLLKGRRGTTANEKEKEIADSAEHTRRARILCLARLAALAILFVISVIRTVLIRHIDHPWPSIVSAFLIHTITIASIILVTIFRYRRLDTPPSGYTWITLCGFLVLGIPEFIVSAQIASGGGSKLFSAATFFVQFSVVLISLVAFSISDHVLQNDMKEWPEEFLSFPNTLVFWWLIKVMIKGYRNALSLGDMFTVSKSEDTRSVYGRFQKNLDREFGAGKGDGSQEKHKQPNDWAMFRVFMRTFCKPVLAATVLEFFNATLMFVAPLIITWLMQFVRHSETPQWHGFVYVGILFGAALLRSFTSQYQLHYMNKFGIRARAAVVAAVYRKSLTLSSEARRISNTGEIVNLMAVDSMRFVEVANWLQLLWSAPYQVIFGLYFIYGIVGHAVWAGVAVMVVIFTCTSIVSKEMQKMQTKQLREKDKRIRLFTEMLSGMKVVKLYAWEPAFERLVDFVRVKELTFLRRCAYLQGIVNMSYCCTNLLSCLSIFGVYSLINPSHNVTAEVSLVVLTVFNMIYMPFTRLPLAVSFTMMTSASVTRLRQFFCQEDLVTYIESRKNDSMIEVENASFSWDSKELTLKDINLSVKPGQLVAVVGSVGSGKSSLINALCGEMQKRSGSVFANGGIAYVAQQAWIQNMTVRDNILFGRPYDERRYQRIVQACSLKPDLALLTNGDMTVIGERGSNLSGGQKQRISLARAVYQDADIYLLDDPLSAVDIHVGKAIFDAVIGPSGLLKDKARLFVTHGIHYLPLCDSIILMEKGKFHGLGTFEELAKRRGVYAAFAEQNLIPQKENVSNERKTSVGDTTRTRKVSRTRTRTLTLTGTTGIPDCKILLRRMSAFRQSQCSITDNIQITASNEDEADDSVEEDMTVGTVGWRTYWHYAKYSGTALLMNAIFLLLSEGSYMAGVMWMEIWTDTVPVADHLGSNSTPVEDHKVISSAEGIGVLGACTMAQLITTIVFSLYFVWYSIRASTKIHQGLLKNILRAPMSFFDTTPSGRLTNRFGKDLNTVDTQIPLSFSAVIHFLIITVTFLTPIMYGTPIFIPILCPLIILYVLFQKFYVASSRQFRRLEAVTRSPIYSHFQESIHGMATIRGYHQQERFSAESDRLVDINDSVQMTLLTCNRWLGVQLDFIGNLMVSGAAMVAVLSRTSTLPGLIGLSVSYALGFTDLLNWGVNEMNLLETEIVAWERVKEYMDVAAEAEWTSTEAVAATVPPDWPVKGVVEFENYATAYRPGLPLVLKDFECRIRDGEKVGVVGRTGAGKSSLTLALFRLIEPVDGTIRLDGIDISQLGLHDLRRKLSIIPQEPVLFSGTLRQNIDPFEQYADADLFKALELSHLTAFVKSLDGGLSHEISEGGANLSVGQRQLLCLARALLRKTKLLILDEATASVDVETDAFIQSTVREQFSDCTVITIAHRLNTILDYDRVMVLHNGRLIEYGCPAELIDNELSEFGKMVQEAGIRISSSDLTYSANL